MPKFLCLEFPARTNPFILDLAVSKSGSNENDYGRNFLFAGAAHPLEPCNKKQGCPGCTCGYQQPEIIRQRFNAPSMMAAPISASVAVDLPTMMDFKMAISRR